MKPHRLLELLGLTSILLASGCGPLLHSVSSAPVSTDGEMHRPLFDRDRIELTRGVALAVDCREPWFGQPCDDMKVHTDDPAIATAHIAHLDKYRSEYNGYVYEEQAQRSVLVLAARSAGTTTLRITSGDGDRNVEVIVAP